MNILDHKTKGEIIEKIKTLECAYMMKGSHNYDDYVGKKIGYVAKTNASKYFDRSKEIPAISIIDVVLAAHTAYNKIVIPRIEKFEKDGILSIKSLLHKYTNSKPEEFKKYWEFNSSSKYETLGGILKAYLNLKSQAKPELSEYEIMNEWARSVDINNLNDNLIGKLPNIGIATIQHLRMNFGIDTVKPDQRVKEVLEKEFDLKLNGMNAIKVVEQIGEITRKNAIEIDQIFVLYGSGYYNQKDKSISNFDNTIKKNKITKMAKQEFISDSRALIEEFIVSHNDINSGKIEFKMRNEVGCYIAEVVSPFRKDNKAKNVFTVWFKESKLKFIKVENGEDQTIDLDMENFKELFEKKFKIKFNEIVQEEFEI